MNRMENWQEGMRGMKVGVIGDFCLDRNNQYNNTKLKSLEYDAVPIERNLNPDTEFAPGGAGNVAVNFRKLGANVITFGVRGMDFASLYLMHLFGQQGIQHFGLIPDRMGKTPRYEKFYLQDKENKSQTKRLDTYNDNPVSLGIQQILLDVLRRELKYLSAVYIADQIPTEHNPCITPYLRENLEKILSETGVPVMVDSRERTREWIKSGFILKPNQKEIWEDYGNAEEFIMNRISEDESMKELFEDCTQEFLNRSNSPFMYVTLHDRGAVLFQKNSQPIYIPTLPFENGDPTGCGDALGSASLTALVVGETPLEAAKFGNAAAYHTIQQIGGCGMPTLEELFKNYGTIYEYGKWW